MEELVVVDDKKSSIGVSDIVPLAVSVVFLIGIFTFFSSCPGPKDDGTWMVCHWAGRAVGGVAAVMVVISAIHLFVSDAKMKMGLAIAIMPLAVLAAVIPGNLINLCMMATMRCHTVMHPAVIVMSVLMIAAAAFDLVAQRKKLK